MQRTYCKTKLIIENLLTVQMRVNILFVPICQMQNALSVVYASFNIILISFAQINICHFCYKTCNVLHHVYNFTYICKFN